MADRVEAIRQRHEATTRPEWRETTDVGVLLAEVDRLRRVEQAARELVSWVNGPGGGATFASQAGVALFRAVEAEVRNVG